MKPPKPPRTAAAPQEVRLIGGRWKRTPLPVLQRPGMRPTPARVRETLFNWLGQDLSGWRCVDAFAGTGALGLEAASRGAAEVVLENHANDAARLTRDASGLPLLADAGADVVGVDSGQHYDPELSQVFYDELSRVLRRKGKLFHYTGTPNKLTSGRDVPAEVSQRLRRAGFTTALNGDGVLAVKR